MPGRSLVDTIRDTSEKRFQKAQSEEGCRNDVVEDGERHRHIYIPAHYPPTCDPFNQSSLTDTSTS